MPKSLRYVIVTLGTVLIVAVVLAAVLLGVARLLLPTANQYRAEIEQRLSTSFERPIKLGEIGIGWRGLKPVVAMSDVRIMDNEANRVLLRIGTAQYGVNVLHYLRYRELGRGDLTISATTLPLRRLKDGSVIVEGFGAEHGVVMDWLAGQKRLTLDNSRITWQDDTRPAAEALQLRAVHVSLVNKDARHRVDGTAHVAGANPQALAVSLDFTGALREPARWSGTFGVKGVDVQWADWVDAPLAGIQIQAGNSDFRLSGRWQEGALQAVQGDVTGSGLRLVRAAAPREALTLRRGSARLDWQRQAHGWRLTATDVAFTNADEPPQAGPRAPPVQVTVLYAAAPTEPAHLDARFNTLRLQDARALLQLSDVPSPALREALAGLQPQGTAQELSVNLRAAAPGQALNAQEFSARARLTGVSTQPWRHAPALQNLNATLQADARSGALQLDSRAVQLTAPRMFQEPLTLDTLSGQLSWRAQGQGWRVESSGLAVKNADVEASVRGSADIPSGLGSPLLDVTWAFGQGDLSKLPRYLPLNLLPADAVHWLNRAFVSGRITAGTGLLRGRLADFPFSTGQGAFDVRLNVSDVLLQYAQHWPALERLNASVHFHGPALTVEASTAAIFGAAVQQARAAIPHLGLDRPILQVQGKVRGRTEQALRFIQESPLKERLGDHTGNLSASSGHSVIDLELTLPLGDGPSPNVRPAATARAPETQVQGRLELSDSTLRLSGKQVAETTLTGINGVLQFSEDSVMGKDIAATWSDYKMRLDVRTQTSADQVAADAQRVLTGKALLIEARSRVSAAALTRQLRKTFPDARTDLLARLSGTTDWSATLRLRDDAAGRLVTDVTLKTPLQGMAIDLPAPLGKVAEQALPLQIGTRLSDQPVKHYTVSYGDRFAAALEAAQPAKTWELKRGALHAGSAAVPALPPQGLRLTGALPYLSITAWRDLLSGPGAKAPSSGAQSSQLQNLNAVDLRIDKLEAGGSEFTQTHIQATRGAQEWTVNLNSEQVAGTVHLPHAANAAWVMDFERLHLAKTEDAAAQDSKLDPRRLPPLRISSASFKYGELDLGRITVEAGQRPGGLHIDTLKMVTPLMQMTGQGDWIMENGQPVSRFDLTVNSDELGATLGSLGYTTNIAGGKTHLEMDAWWPGAPMDFAAARLNGKLAINIEKGRFLDIEPGPGRVFGLLSLQALPRRLSLDFSDFFQKGFAFDRVVGEFRLENGNAYTDNLVMAGPSAKIRVSGRTGLAAKDYDQVVTVKPQIGSSLPLAGILAGGVGIGAAILLAQQLFKPQIDDIAGYQYTIKGAWSDPQVERVVQQNAKETSN